MARRKADRSVKPGTPQKSEPVERPDGSSVDRWRPWLLAVLCALFVARPLYPSESAAAQGDGLPIVMLWLVLALFWLLGVIGRREFALRFGWTDGAVALLVGLHSLAALWAAWDSNPRPAINMLWEWVAFGVSYFLARQLITGHRETRAVVVVMVAVALSLAVHGLYQYFYEMPATLAAYQKDPDRALQEAGLWFEPGSREREQFEKRLASVEPVGTFALTNSLAGYLAPWLVMALGIGVAAMRPSVVSHQEGVEGSEDATLLGNSPHPKPLPKGEGTNERPHLWFVVTPVALPIAVCLLLTKSRSAYVATLFGLLLTGVILPRRFRLNWRLLGAVAAIGGVLLATVIGIGGLDRFVWSEASKSLGYRLEYWRATLQMIGDHPLAGCGPGHFQHAYTVYKLPQASEEIADPHNFLFEVWATAGTPTFLALLGVLGSFFWAMVCRTAASEASTASPPAVEVDAPVAVLLGGGLGFLLSVPLGLMSSAPPGFAPVVLGLPLAIGMACLFWSWIDHGDFPSMLPVIGVVVLLVNLLAAGGMGLPGVAGTLWLLMAVGLARTGQEPHRLSARDGLVPLAVGVVIAVACYASAYAPVMRYQAAMRLAHEEPLRAADHLHEAIAADALAAEPWKQLANLAFQAWQQQPSSETFKQFEQAVEGALARESKAASTWLYYGDRYFDVFERTREASQRQAALRTALKMYRQAASFYPNSATVRAKLALAYQAAGQSADFQREAGRALELDAITPHSDKRLPDDLREVLKRSGSQKNGSVILDREAGRSP